MVVYADILFCLNLLVNYFLLLVTGSFCRRKQKRWRLLAAAAFGAVYAMVLFVKGIPPWVLLLSKLIFSAVILRIAFAYVGVWQFVREYIVFFVVNFLFAGLMLALWLCVAPSGMVFYNGVVYFNISAVMLVAFTAIAYAFAEAFSRIYQKRGAETELYTVTIELNERQTMLTGFLDTGNTLKEPYTGYPVAVCDYYSLRGVLPSALLHVFSTGGDNTTNLEQLSALGQSCHFKLIPYTTVGFSGVLPAFMPSKMVLQSGTNSFLVENVYIAVSPQRLSMGNYDILLNAELLPMQKLYSAVKPQKG